MKLRTNDPHRIKNANHGMTGFFAGPVLGESKLCLEVTVQPFDLMSRRHPLSSTRAAINIRFEKQIVVEALVTSPALPPASIVAEESYFFLATFLVFFAVFFTALFAAFLTVFLTAFFVAFLAMLPSNKEMT